MPPRNPKKPQKPRRRLFLLNDAAARRLDAELAAEIGLAESIVLLQLEFLIANSYDSVEVDGNTWYPSSLDDFRIYHFKFWSTATINRILTKLKEANYILIENFNTDGRDRTYSYALNWDGVETIRSIRAFIYTPPELEDEQAEGSSISQNEKRKNRTISRTISQSEKPHLLNKDHADQKDPNMHGEGDYSEPTTNQPGQEGMDACMDGFDQSKHDFLWSCGLRSPELINKLMVLSMQTLEHEWAIVKNSTTFKDIPGAFGRNLKAALINHGIQQRAAAERAANPAAAQTQAAPSNAHPDASRYQRPDFITEAEWYGLRDVHEVYELLDGATFDEVTGALTCRTPRLDSEFFMKRNGAAIQTRFAAIRNWQPQEDWA